MDTSATNQLPPGLNSVANLTSHTMIATTKSESENINIPKVTIENATSINQDTG